MPPKKRQSSDATAVEAGPSNAAVRTPKKENQKKKKKGTAGCIKLKNRDGWNKCDTMIQHLSPEHLLEVTAKCTETIKKYLAENDLIE